MIKQTPFPPASLSLERITSLAWRVSRVAQSAVCGTMSRSMSTMSLTDWNASNSGRLRGLSADNVSRFLEYQRHALCACLKDSDIKRLAIVRHTARAMAM